MEIGTKAYAQCVFVVQPSYKHFSLSKFADCKNMIRILSRPTLSKQWESKVEVAVT